MSDYELGDVREVQTMEIPILRDGEPDGKVIFFFDPADIKGATVSFDDGDSEVPLAIVEAALGQFAAQHPEFAAD